MAKVINLINIIGSRKPIKKVLVGKCARGSRFIRIIIRDLNDLRDIALTQYSKSVEVTV